MDVIQGSIRSTTIWKDERGGSLDGVSYVVSDNMMMLFSICARIITCDHKIMNLYGSYGGVGSNDA